jgi:hypothetical protein
LLHLSSVEIVQIHRRRNLRRDAARQRVWPLDDACVSLTQRELWLRIRARQGKVLGNARSASAASVRAGCTWIRSASKRVKSFPGTALFGRPDRGSAFDCKY